MSNFTATGAAQAAQQNGIKLCTCGETESCTNCPPIPLYEAEIKRSEAYQIFETQLNFLMGKVLTVVDASYSDREQRKAVKDLMKQQFYAQSKHVDGVLTGRNQIVTAGEGIEPTH